MVVNLFEINMGSLRLIVSDDSVDFVGKANQFF